MLGLLTDSWNAVQDALRRQVGDGPYESWLAGLRPLGLERGTAWFEARNRMATDRVRRLYAPILIELLSAEIGTRIQVEVMAPPEDVGPDRLEVGPQAPVVDEANRTAFLVLKALLEGKEMPGSLYLFHGPAGSGKTFLLRWWLDRSSGREMVFDLPRLTTAFQAVARDGRFESFRAELTRDRVLVLDEVHRLSGKRRLQQELLRVLKDRTRLDRLTVLASRWHPRDIRDLDPALESVLLSGFVTGVGLPGPAGRLRYLRALEGTPSRNGRKEEVEELAARVQGSYTDLRKAWLLEKETRPAAVQRRYLQLYEPRSMFHRVLERVCQRLGVETAAVLGPSQARRISLARKIVAWLCVQEGLTRAEVGRFMDGRSRAAISYLTRTLQQDMARSVEVRQTVESLL